MKKWVIGGGVAVLVIGGMVWWQTQKSQPQMTAEPEQLPSPTAAVQPEAEEGATDPLNATYTIDGQKVTLTDGKAEVPAAPGSATMETTTVFGQPTMGQLTDATSDDAAVILVRETGGSGTFYYQAAAINQGGQYTGTNGILLGDRIAPQTTEIRDMTIIANFAQVPEGEPMTVQPSEGVSKYFEIDGTTLVEVTQPQGQM